MKILFVENRLRTIFWEEMASLLLKDGHQVGFIVENHSYVQNIEGIKYHYIPYPKHIANAEDSCGTLFDNIKLSDRAIRHFALNNNSHYKYYYDRISSIINEIRPDIVFGESTAFHELLAIEICKSLNILYLHPNTCRYPIGRFSFYRYNTLEPEGGLCEKLDLAEINDIIDNIKSRRVVPDYMKTNPTALKSRWKRVCDLASHSFAYYRGERYNTPSPLRKIKLEYDRKQSIAAWETLVTSRAKTNRESFKILYPLQMQPEANLDVWGRKYNNQVKLLEDILANTASNINIIVKPNPKSKYEMSQELVAFVSSEPRIIPVRHSTPMAEVLSHSDMVLTVTGTIAIECILSNMPVVTLVETLNNNSRNCRYIHDITELQSVIETIKSQEFARNSESDNAKYINSIISSSYIGLPYERYMNPENIANCKKAFDHVIAKITSL